MEYPNLVEPKKRNIASFLNIYNQHWARKKTIPYSQSLYSLADSLSAIDYAYETAYAESHGVKPTKTRHYPSMLELVEALHSQNVSSSMIRHILGYEEAEVNLMVDILDLPHSDS